MINQTPYSFLTSNKKLLDDNDYKKITAVISKMIKNGVVTLGRGNCLSMSDIVQTALLHYGISSRLVECELALTYLHVEPPEISFVGYSNIHNPGEIDTHVVLITNTSTPMLIDASISHRLPESHPVIIDSVSSFELSSSKFAELVFENKKIKATYKEKQTYHIPSLHQSSIIDRIITDKKIFDTLSLLKILIVIALILSLSNFIRGSYDFYQVYFNNENMRGPSGFESIDKRLDYIEDILNRSSLDN
jgi:hypothetical protein